MHLPDDTIRAYLDCQLPSDVQTAAETHILECSFCEARAQELKQQSSRVGSHISQLMSTQIPIRPKVVFRLVQNHKKEIDMIPLYKRPAFAGAVILAALLVSLAFPPVRALASNFLGLFRVDQVRVFTFDPAHLNQVSNGMETSRNQIDTFFQDNIRETHQGEFQPVGSPQEMAAIAGFTPRLPGLDSSTLGVQPGAEISIILDTELINTVLATFDLESYQLSSEFNGKQVAVHVPASAVFTSGNCDLPVDPSDPDDQTRLDCISLIQMPSPQADIPQGLDVASLGEAMFQVLGMTADEAAAFSQSIDWATTLVLPIPVGQGIQHEEVQVDGVTGSLITDTASSMQTLIWSRNGRLYAMNSNQTGVDLLAIANQLK
jgi:anti-sigma factor RsiW